MEGFPCSSTVKESACNAGDLGSIPGLGRFPREGKIYPLWYRELNGRVVQSLCHVWLFETPWTAAHQASLSFWSLLRLMSIESVMPSNHLIFCCPLLLLSSIFPRIRVFPNKSVLRIRWPKYWSFSFSISPSSEYSVLIFFRFNWFDLLVVQGTLNSLLQYSILKASILWLLVFETRETGDTEK